jgi:hypothetical protein
MRQHSGLRRVARVLGVCSLLSFVACQSPGSQRIVGPDGSAMAHVHCGTEQGVCFRIAGELCPSGYEMKPVLSGSDGNFLVRCRSKAAPVAAACPTPSPAATPTIVATRSPDLMAPWPPAAEPASAANPWPSPQTSAAVRSQPGTASAPGDVDVGY